MTSTLTRPPAAAPPGGPRPASPPPPAPAWLVSGDHKHLGLLFSLGGLAALAVSAAAVALFLLPSTDAGVLFWTRSGSRLAAVAAASGLVIGMPALWVGLATYVVPLQIGATRLALPRMHSLALWTYFTGGLLAAVGFVADDGSPLPSLAGSAPAVAGREGGAEAVRELVVAGLLLVALATFLAAVGLLVTIANRRAEGMRLAYLPLFSWSTLFTATVVVLAAPVFMAGLVLLFYDQHYGGTLLVSGPGGLRVWQHLLWVPGQPMALLFAVACLGVFGDVVATAARRPLVGVGAARAAAAGAALLTLLLWTGNLSTLVSPFSPISTLGAVTLGVPVALSLITWLATLRAGAVRAHPALVPMAAFVGVAALAAGLSLAGAFADIEGFRAEAFRNGQITLLVFGAPVLGLAAAAIHWAPKLSGRGLGGAPVIGLVLAAGVVLMATPAYVVGFGGSAGSGVIGCAGAALVAAALLMILGGLLRPRTSGPSNPHGGLTLEWATASPPPPHNFDELPPVESPYPLADAAPAP